jgi:hypothetical protein
VEAICPWSKRTVPWRGSLWPWSTWISDQRITRPAILITLLWKVLFHALCVMLTPLGHRQVGLGMAGLLHRALARVEAAGLGEGANIVAYSGGVDSSLVAALVHRVFPTNSYACTGASRWAA